MQFKDYYKIMGLDESATLDEIKKSYRKLARRYHPDVSKEEDAEQKFKELGEAYEVLKNKEKRQEYDQLRARGAMNQEGQFTPPPEWEAATQFSENGFDSGEFSDFFSSMFGSSGNFHRSYQQDGSQQFRMRGDDAHSELPLFLEDIVQGCEKLITLSVPSVDQQGLVTHQTKKLKVKIPAGTVDGQHLRIRGQGAPGIGGEKPGDLMITIRLAPHPLYSLNGKDITLLAPVTPWEAALGEKITVPSIHGKIKVTIPPLSQSGTKLRLAGKGLPGEPAGDFFVVIKIVMPENETDKSKELFSQLADEVGFNPRSHWEGK